MLVDLFDLEAVHRFGAMTYASAIISKFSHEPCPKIKYIKHTQLIEAKFFNQLNPHLIIFSAQSILPLIHFDFWGTTFELHTSRRFFKS